MYKFKSDYLDEYGKLIDELDRGINNECKQNLNPEVTDISGYTFLTKVDNYDFGIMNVVSPKVRKDDFREYDPKLL